LVYGLELARSATCVADRMNVAFPPQPQPNSRQPSRSSPRAPASKRSCSRIARKGEPAIAEFDHVLSSEPPMRKPEPGAPRMLGSGIELDTDLRDCIPLHVAHNQFHGTEARAVSDRRPAVEPARQKPR